MWEREPGLFGRLRRRASRREGAIAPRPAIPAAAAPPPSAPPAPAGTGPAVTTPPPRVLVVATDRRFRAVTSTLLTQRGCEVSVYPARGDIRAQASRQRVDVVVLDATASLTTAAHTAARLQSLRPKVGLVAVSSDPRDRLDALAVIPKWGSLDGLYRAIESARPRGAHV
jgi:CheY-like chemotaxis protein